jgi:hypothetical protein
MPHLDPAEISPDFAQLTQKAATKNNRQALLLLQKECSVSGSCSHAVERSTKNGWVFYVLL